ncbi:Uncharacterised protein [uncultured archaeon]|nr:Uncharacterised protein [uncultured archaeon]
MGKLGEGKIMTEERPKVGDPLALYWVLGTIDAARGVQYNECPFRRDMNTGRLWERGHQAYTAEHNKLKGEK